ncbi:MAG: hypothetical protein BWY82_01476 [Verrucomicrobia bacterium ADurb.Bin474]|nr:MAG: hypothetical protein BWY82_01476 [Verrucomicrobia bacterium ADurb.Bin474]
MRTKVTGFDKLGDADFLVDRPTQVHVPVPLDSGYIPWRGCGEGDNYWFGQLCFEIVKASPPVVAQVMGLIQNEGLDACFDAVLDEPITLFGLAVIMQRLIRDDGQ